MKYQKVENDDHKDGFGDVKMTGVGNDHQYHQLGEDDRVHTSSDNLLEDHNNSKDIRKNNSVGSMFSVDMNNNQMYKDYLPYEHGLFDINNIYYEREPTDVERYIFSDAGNLQINPERIINDSHKKDISVIKLICLSLTFLGVQFGWALQIAYSTPLFLELGVSRFWVSFIWIAGPISGLVVQPLVGVLSDRSESKFGRRKPYILIGSIFIIVGLLLISNSTSIGYILGDSKDKKSLSILFAIIGFWILDLSNNAVQGPCRALLVDIASPEKQSLGSSLFSIMLGLGNLLGYLMGSLKLTSFVPFMKTDIRALFTLSIIILVFCVFFTLVCIKEDRYTRVQREELGNPIKQLAKGILHMPNYLKRLCAVQFFSWIGWFSFILFITTWVGVNVCGGDPDAPEGSLGKMKFQEGVRVGSLGLTFSSLVTIVVSLMIPILVQKIGIKLIYFIGCLVQTIAFGVFYFVHSQIGALIVITLTGIPWAIVMVIPFCIVGLGAKEHDENKSSIDGTSNETSSGLQIGILNIFIVIPQLLIAVGISFVISLFRGNLVVSLITGSISSLVATILVYRIIVPPKIRIEEVVTDKSFSIN